MFLIVFKKYYFCFMLKFNQKIFDIWYPITSVLSTEEYIQKKLSMYANFYTELATAELINTDTDLTRTILTMSLRILSKLDLTKVHLINTREKCKNLALKISNIVHFGMYSLEDLTLAEYEIINFYSSFLKTNELFVYKIIDSIYIENNSLCINFAFYDVPEISYKGDFKKFIYDESSM